MLVICSHQSYSGNDLPGKDQGQWYLDSRLRGNDKERESENGAKKGELAGKMRVEMTELDGNNKKNRTYPQK